MSAVREQGALWSWFEYSKAMALMALLWMVSRAELLWTASWRVMEWQVMGQRVMGQWRVVLPVRQ